MEKEISMIKIVKRMLFSTNLKINKLIIKVYNILKRLKIVKLRITMLSREFMFLLFLKKIIKKK